MSRGSALNVPKADLRELLETNLLALHALLEQQQRMLDVTVRTIAGLRADIRVLSDQRAPWVKALSDTRALLYVALHEVVAQNQPHVAQNEPHDTQAFERIA